MSLPAATVWEVRPTVGSDTNGGGFVTGASGSDYSLQNSKNTVGSDISTTDGVGNGTTTFTSATGNFSTSLPGNIIYLSGTGITTGWYEVVSRASSISITLDRSPGTGTGVTMNIGGALATVGAITAAYVANNTIWIKATGTLTVTTTLTITLDSTPAPGTPLSFIGYTTTRGDNGQVTWTTATNSTNLVNLNVARNVLFQNIIFTNTAGTSANGILSSNSSTNSQQVYLINCKLSGFTVGLEGNFTVDTAFDGLVVMNCRITSCSSHGIRNGGTTYILGSIIDNCGGDGFNSGTSQLSPAGMSYLFENSIFYKNTANGINFVFSNAGGTRQILIVVSGCDCSTNTGAGILMENVDNPLAQISNSIFDANGTYGVDCASGTTTPRVLLINNAFYNNTTAATRNTNAGVGTVTLSASPYTSIGTDFSLNSTSGGGAACKSAGFPGVLQFGGTGFTDIGALQSAGSGGGTTVYVVNQNVTRHITEEI